MLSKINSPSVLVRDCLDRSLLLHKAWNKQSTSTTGSQSKRLGSKIPPTVCKNPAKARPCLALLNSYGVTERMLKIHRYLTMTCPRARII